MLLSLFIHTYNYYYYRGSFAVVRIGVSYKTKTKFAIKEIYTSDFLPEQLDDLEREINILSQFRHNNIVRLHEIYRDDKATYMVLFFSFSFLKLFF